MKEEVIRLYRETEMSRIEIRNKVGLTRAQTDWIIDHSFSEEFRKNRGRISYRNSKLGDKNPMKDKFAEKHHNFIGDISDGKGYLMRIKPDWYTGRKGCKHVFVHHLVMCELLNMTEIPHGFNVHHIDKNKTNNNINNLALLTSEAHTRLHNLERATTRGNP